MPGNETNRCTISVEHMREMREMEHHFVADRKVRQTTLRT